MDRTSLRSQATIKSAVEPALIMPASNLACAGWSTTQQVRMGLPEAVNTSTHRWIA